MAPGFGGDTGMGTRPAPTEGGGPTSVRSDPGLQAPIPPPIPEPIPDRAGPDRAGEGDRPRLPDVRVTEPGGGYGPAPTGMLPPPRPPQDWPSDIYPDYSPGPRKPPSRHPENVRPVFEVDYVPGYGPAPGPPGPPSPPWMPEGAAPPPRPEPPPPPGPPRPRGPQIDWMPGDPGYNPDEGRGLRPPGDTGRGLQRDTDRERMLSDIAERGLDRGQSDQLLPIDQTFTARPDRYREQQRERDMQRAQRRDARRARPLRA